MSIWCFDIGFKRNDWMDGQETLSEQKYQTKKNSTHGITKMLG